jgi:hypothetical protein
MVPVFCSLPPPSVWSNPMSTKTTATPFAPLFDRSPASAVRLSDGDLWYAAGLLSARRGDREASAYAARHAIAAYRVEQDTP